MEDIIKLKANYLGDGQHKINCPSCGNNRKKKNLKTLSVHVIADKIKYQCWHCNLTGTINYNINYGKAKVVDMFNPHKEKESWKDLGTSAIKFFKTRGYPKPHSTLTLNKK